MNRFVSQQGGHCTDLGAVPAGNLVGRADTLPCARGTSLARRVTGT